MESRDYSRERSMSSSSHSRRTSRSSSPYPPTHSRFSKSPSFPYRSHSQSRSRSKSRSVSRYSRDRVRDDKTTPTRPAENQTNDSVFPLSKAKFQKRVLFLLTDIRKELATMNRSTTVSADDGYVVTRAETLQDLHDVERSLRTIEERKLMVQTMSKVGGVTVRDNAKRILEKLMTNELMSQFNMTGNNGKQAFKSTNLFGVVQASTMKSHQSATEQEIIHAVASCLKYAPDRRGGAGRKSKENQRD